ncbi:TonB-linked outer membrane protein, SusC/RagA family [Filimonas lacunae]|uniref:TonB-linked outer membrane protein, SusC/RagA family n=1 Tax=Filimonas lacunae TaxID=477680 RepID=A0A1N7MAK2_9BACT|nr:SusC/RagA family TonB-linked outer membrane protein [Filimonas lacunae]SIS83009.1 TonB-linked outer membrane protein, SusC/RagA family [Filimonas lacunae]
MRLVLLLTTVASLQVSAKGLSQNVTIRLKNAPIEKAFLEMRKQTGFQFVYNTVMLQQAGNVNLSVTGMPLEKALKLALSGKSLSYAIVDSVVVIKALTMHYDAPLVLNAAANNIGVSGVVKDAEGTPLQDVSVMVKGTKNITTTDKEGRFEFKSISENSILVFNAVGFVAKEVKLGATTEKIAVELKATENKLSEVVVSTGYQNLNQKLFTGATVKLNAKDAQRSGIPDVSRMLEGQVAGVSVQNVSGTFGAAPKIRVRGATSLSGDNKPLWVVDGIILEDIVNISNEALSTGDANTLIGSSVAGLSPDDIESFTILKDAAATALYGARAMNGVIVVTTKKGRNTQGKANMNYSGNFTTYLKPSYSQFDIMNSADQMSVMIEMENKGYLRPASVATPQNGGIFYKLYNQMYNYDAGSDSWALSNDQNLAGRNSFLQRYARANTDWFNVLFKNSLMQEHAISVTAGTDKFQNYFSSSYMHDNGQTLGDAVTRYTANNRTTIKVNNKLSIEFLTNASVRNQRAPGTLTRQSDAVYGAYSRSFDINPYTYAINTSRMITPYDQKGDLEYFVMNWAPFNIVNELNNNYLKLQMMDIKIQGGLKYKITPELQYSIDGAYRFAQTTRNHYIKASSNMAAAFRAYSSTSVVDDNTYLYDDPDNNELPVVVLPDGGFFNTYENKISNYYVRNNLEYDKTIKDHKFNLFASMEARTADRQNYNFDGVGYDYENGGVVNVNYRYFKKATEGGDAYFAMSNSYDRFLAYMFRGAYNYNGKYSFNFTTRMDGSNKMGKSEQARWLPTWNVSGAWDIDNEKFFKPGKVLSSVRLRATYGLVGNIGNASNTAALYYNRVAYRPYETEKETQTYISSLANTDLTWEKTNEVNIGTDLGLFNGNVNVTIDWYNRKIHDLISDVQTSGIGGEDTKTINNGTMDAHGLEFTIGGAPVKNSRPDGFRWRTQLNWAINKNKITRLEMSPRIWDVVRAEGGTVEGYAQRGLFSIPFDGLSSVNGSPTYISEAGIKDNYINLQSTTVKYLKYEGPTDPTFTGGFFNKFDYKNFSISALVTYSWGNYVRLQPIFAASYDDLYSMSKVMKNRWIMPGDETVTKVPSILDKYSYDQFTRLSTGTSLSPRYAYNAYNYSDQRVAKGDFIRLKTVSVSYQMPQRLVKRLGLNAMQFSLVGNNIALLYSDKNLLGQDPEFISNGGVAMPVPKQFTFSLKAGL